MSTPEHSQGRNFPNQKFGWVLEPDGTWSLYSETGVKLISTTTSAVTIPSLPGGSISVTDGTTTVDPASVVDFTSNATVTRSGTTAEVAVSGGGSQPPDSWLLAEVDTPLTASGTLAWDLLGSAGPDIEIDGDDNTTINILTPGNYTVLVYRTNFQGDATGYGFAAIVIAGTILNQDWLAYNDGAPENGVLVTPPSFQYYSHVDAPAIQVADACTVQVAVTIGANGDPPTLTATITVGSGTQLLIRRNA